MAVVFLHGLGDTPAGWSSLRREMPMFHRQAGIGPVDPPLRFEFPAAPTAAVTISGGEMQTSWFDLFDWPIGLKARDDRDGLMASVKTVHALVDKLVSEGIPASKIVVGGFSQGGAIALLATYFYPARLAGCVCLSGWLTMRDTFEKSLQSQNNNTPCYWGHGFMDQVVLPEQQKAGAKLMSDLGIPVDAKAFPIGHSAHPLEMKEVAAFVAEHLGLLNKPTSSDISTAPAAEGSDPAAPAASKESGEKPSTKGEGEEPAADE